MEARFEIIEDKVRPCMQLCAAAWRARYLGCSLSALLVHPQLKLVQENLKYFLELQENKQNQTLEWTIIILIAAEIIVSLYDLSHKGGLL